MTKLVSKDKGGSSEAKHIVEFSIVAGDRRYSVCARGDNAVE
jgi:hypothetical protein